MNGKSSRWSGLNALSALVLAGTLVLGGCDDAGPTDPDSTLTWLETAVLLRGNNGNRYTFQCPAGGTAHAIWGTDTYTDDSSICTAAVHAGKITLAAGGAVTIEIRPGQASYAGSTRNGITSSEYDDWLGSFMFR